jgi:ABC-type lipoprotein export system ATPase subunit
MIPARIRFHVASFKINLSLIARQIHLGIRNAIALEFVMSATIGAKRKITHVLHNAFLWHPAQPIIIGKHEKHNGTTDGYTNQVPKQALFEIHAVRLLQKSWIHGVNKSSHHLLVDHLIFVQTLNDMIAISGLRFQYENVPSFSFPDFTCAAGEHLLILGESGRGKTTLLHLLAGMIKPKDGDVIINGTSTKPMGQAELDKFRGQNIGIIFQTAHFVESLSVIDNLMLSPFLSGKNATTADAQAALQRLNIGHKSKEKPRNLSVGEQQRVAIARAVFHKPAVILADEPTSALDDHNANEVINLLEEQAQQTGAALIIVTHDKRLKDRFQKQITL